MCCWAWPGCRRACAAFTESKAAMSLPPRALNRAAFFTLLFTACLFGANHVAARLAFNNGLDVASAVTVRSLLTAAVVGLLVWLQRAPHVVTPRQRGFLLLI